MTNKDTIALIFVSFLTVAAVVYGFSTIPNPAKQRALKLDHKRVTDLAEIQKSISAYYTENNMLPQNITGLTKQYYDSEIVNTKDPETGKEYEYITTGPTSYQLCATFATSSAEEANAYDSENYLYSRYKKDFPHPVGYQCFPFSETPKYQYQQPYAVPTMNRISPTPVVNTVAQ